MYLFPLVFKIFIFQVQNYVKINNDGGQGLNLDEWENLYNISTFVGSDLAESEVVKMIAR